VSHYRDQRHPCLITAVVALFGNFSVAERLVYFTVGVGFAGYGIYVLNQTSGTWTFPIELFVLPLIVFGRAATSSGQSRAK